MLEQTKVGALLGASPLPSTAAELSGWVSGHPAIASSPAQAEAIEFLGGPPLPLTVRPGYRLLYEAAVATVPPGLAAVVGVRRRAWARALGGRTVRSLRWALGSSPSWHLALVRAGVDVPDGLFRQPGPVHADATRRA